MNPADAPPLPTGLLIIDDIWRHPGNEEEIHAQIRTGGHPWQVIVDFARSGLIRYIRMPWMLTVHLPSQKAVLGLMNRFRAGEAVKLPLDLSDALAAADPPSPFQVDPAEDARLERESASVSVDLAQMQRSGTYPALFRGVIRLNGEALDLEVELYTGPGRVPVLRCNRVSRTLTPLEWHAVRYRLLKVIS